MHTSDDCRGNSGGGDDGGDGGKYFVVVMVMVGGGGDCGGRLLHSNRCLRVKTAYCIRRRGSDCGSGGSGSGSGGGTMAHSLWETAYENI